MDVIAKFLGGSGVVTGSKYLIDLGDFEFLVDCGLFQGGRKLRELNWDKFPMPLEDLEAVVLTHAHLDHIGYLPRLVQQGFKGPIYCTEATASLAKILLLDSGKLQEEEAEYARKKGYSRHENPQPLYTKADAEAVFPQFVPQPFEKPFRIILERTLHLDKNSSLILWRTSPDATATLKGRVFDQLGAVRLS